MICVENPKDANLKKKKTELINSANLQDTKSLHKNLGAFLY